MTKKYFSLFKRYICQISKTWALNMCKCLQAVQVDSFTIKPYLQTAFVRTQHGPIMHCGGVRQHILTDAILMTILVPGLGTLHYSIMFVIVLLDFVVVCFNLLMDVAKKEAGVQDTILEMLVKHEHKFSRSVKVSCFSSLSPMCFSFWEVCLWGGLSIIKAEFQAEIIM